VTFSDDFFAIFAMQQQDLTQGREDFSRAKTKEWFSQQGHERLKDMRLKIRLCGLCGLCCEISAFSRFVWLSAITRFRSFRYLKLR
jgi:hypothetical protein